MELLEVTYFHIHWTLQVYKLPSQLRQEICNTNNMVAEYKLLVFDQKSKVAHQETTSSKLRVFATTSFYTRVHFQSP